MDPHKYCPRARTKEGAKGLMPGRDPEDTELTAGVPVVRTFGSRSPANRARADQRWAPAIVQPGRRASGTLARHNQPLRRNKR